MLSKFFTIIVFLGASLSLFAQENSNKRKPHETDSEQSKSASAMAMSQNISLLEKSITEKILKLETLQIRASVLNKNLKEKVYIADEVPAIAIDGNKQIVTSRHIEFAFQTEKAKELKIISQKKNMVNDLYSVVRTLTFTPGNFSSIKLKIDKFDTRIDGLQNVEAYDDMLPEIKLIVLKAIDQVCFNTIYRFDTLIQKEENNHLDNTITNFTE